MYGFPRPWNQLQPLHSLHGRAEEPEEYRSGQLARRCGVSTDTLRYHERRGLIPLPRRRANGYRSYPAEAVSRVLLVRRAFALGFTADELLPLLRSRVRGVPPCRQVRALAAQRLAEAEARLAEMARFRDSLRATLESWDARLEETAPGAEARLLEAPADLDAFAGPGSQRARAGSSHQRRRLPK